MIRSRALPGMLTAVGVVMALIGLVGLGFTQPWSTTAVGAGEKASARISASSHNPLPDHLHDSQVEKSPGSMGLVALTFDDGPSVITPQLLDVLKAKNVKATFFLQGTHVVQYPEVVRRLHDEGHVIGNHGWSHTTFDTLDDAEAYSEIVRTNDAIRAITGETPILFRYPKGMESDSGNKAIRSLGMWGGVLWHWDTGAGDYSCPGASSVLRYLNDNAASQALLLLHDGNEVVDCRSDQPAYLPKAIDTLRERGFEFGVVATAGGPSWVNQHSWVRVIPADLTPAAG